MSMFDDFKKGRQHDPEPRQAGDLQHDEKKARIAKKRGNAISMGTVKFFMSVVGIVLIAGAVAFLGWFGWQAIQAYIT